MKKLAIFFLFIFLNSPMYPILQMIGVKLDIELRVKLLKNTFQGKQKRK